MSFLGQNPVKAAAWVAALNADPNLRWGTGEPLTIAEIPIFIDNLIPTVLQADTCWVTNHGFNSNRATPFQSLLQRGTAVLRRPLRRAPRSLPLRQSAAACETRSADEADG